MRRYALEERDGVSEFVRDQKDAELNETFDAVFDAVYGSDRSNSRSRTARSVSHSSRCLPGAYPSQNV
jgi:hypothetical protein